MAQTVPGDNPTQTDYLSIANNLLIYNQLAHVLELLAAAEIPVILLKGAALGLTVYPEFGARLMGDADLLIREIDILSARKALSEANYQIIQEPEAPFNPFKSAFTGELLFTQDGLVTIDLHWKLISIEWLDRLIQIDPSALWEAAIPIEFEGVPALQLSKVDNLIHLCLHLIVHNFAHPTGFKDILQVLDQNPSFPWEEFLARVTQFKVRTCCFFPLATIAQKKTGSVPESVLRDLTPPGWQKRLVNWIADPNEGLEGILPPSHARSYILHLAVFDHTQDLIMLLLWLFFPGPRWLAERYQLRNQPASWIACLWHPFFVIWQGLSGLKELLATR